jgi:hypothetical protein
MCSNFCVVCLAPLLIDEVKSGICADCEPRSELVDGKWRLCQPSQTDYQLDFGAYIRWLQAQPKGSIVGDVTFSDGCPVHNWLASLDINCYVHPEGIIDTKTSAVQALPEEFVAVQHEMMHELDLDLEDKEDGLISREAALMCAYFVRLTEWLGVPQGVAS